MRPSAQMPVNIHVYQPTWLPIQGQQVYKRYIRRPFDEELLQPHIKCGSPLLWMPILQPLLILEPNNAR
jgi:hypothetical protein